MISFTHSELRKLIFLCDSRWNYANNIIEDTDDEYSDLEKQLAMSEAYYMNSLVSKLNAIIETQSKRVEIKNG